MIYLVQFYHQTESLQLQQNVPLLSFFSHRQGFPSLWKQRWIKIEGLPCRYSVPYKHKGWLRTIVRHIFTPGYLQGGFSYVFLHK